MDLTIAGPWHARCEDSQAPIVGEFDQTAECYRPHIELVGRLRPLIMKKTARVGLCGEMDLRRGRDYKKGCRRERRPLDRLAQAQNAQQRLLAMESEVQGHAQIRSEGLWTWEV